jgi:hypothetical protein
MPKPANHRKYDVVPRFVLPPDEERALQKHMEMHTALPPELEKLGRKVARLCGRSVEILSADGRLLARVRQA